MRVRKRRLRGCQCLGPGRKVRVTNDRTTASGAVTSWRCDASQGEILLIGRSLARLSGNALLPRTTSAGWFWRSHQQLAGLLLAGAHHRLARTTSGHCCSRPPAPRAPRPLRACSRALAHSVRTGRGTGPMSHHASSEHPLTTCAPRLARARRDPPPARPLVLAARQERLRRLTSSRRRDKEER
jgi:hypothetical protein